MICAVGTFPIMRLSGISTSPSGPLQRRPKLERDIHQWSVLVFSVTGLTLWQNRRFPSDLVSCPTLSIMLLAYLALGAFGHLYRHRRPEWTFVTFRPSLKVAIRLAREHHPKWVQTFSAGSTI